MIGSTIGSYRIDAELGEGGMGVVYRGTDTMLDRVVALKALHPQLTRDESRLERFRAEAKALARLHHPNIATLFNFFEQDGVYYMVMEYVDGETLEDLVRRSGALPLRAALEIFNSGLQGFGHAHERGVIHRDIKPSNLMRTRDGEVKITDFGIARVAGGGKLTQTGKLIGTLEYMSPEQVRGLEQDARSDIYSLGILLFELVTGRMPWSATSDFDIMRAHLEEPAPPARSVLAELPPDLDAAISRALAKNPDERFQSVREMREVLEGVLRELPASGQTISPPPAPTRIVAAPAANAVGAVPPTVEGVGLGAGARAASPASTAPVPPTTVVSAPATSRARSKWLWPAVGLGVASLALMGLVAASILRPSAVVAPEPVPTAASTLVRDVERTQSERSPKEPKRAPIVEADAREIERLKGASDTNSSPGDLSNIEIPQNLPGLNPGVGANVAPTKPAATPKPTTRPTAKPVSRPSAPRRARSVASTSESASTPRRRTRARTVKRAAPKKVAAKKSTPRRKAASAAPRRRSGGGGGGEAAALRALIKGG